VAGALGTGLVLVAEEEVEGFGSAVSDLKEGGLEIVDGSTDGLLTCAGLAEVADSFPKLLLVPAFGVGPWACCE